jgi:hypothetical protein
MKTIRMATVKSDTDYTLCSCGAVKLNRFQCFNGCGLVKYPDLEQKIMHALSAQFPRWNGPQVDPASIVINYSGSIPPRRSWFTEYP